MIYINTPPVIWRYDYSDLLGKSPTDSISNIFFRARIDTVIDSTKEYLKTNLLYKHTYLSRDVSVNSFQKYNPIVHRRRTFNNRKFMMFVYTLDLRFLKEFFFERLYNFFKIKNKGYLLSYRAVARLTKKLLHSHTSILDCCVLIKSSGNFHDYGGLRTKTHWVRHVPEKLTTRFRTLDSMDGYSRMNYSSINHKFFLKK